jgi:arylsulfatase A-like enzyme
MRPGSPFSSPERRLNVIVVMTDTLRPDHLGCYGNAADTPRVWEARRTGRPLPDAPAPWMDTRHIDRFATEATLFTRAYAGSFPTIPCRTDLFTGRTVFPHRGWSPLPLEVPCLAQTLAQYGYRTQLIYDPPMLQRNGFGFDRGFQGVRWIRGQTSDGYVVEPDLPVRLEGPPEKWRHRGRPWLQHQRNRFYWRGEEDHFAPRTLRTAEQWLERNCHAGPFFLWVDTWDPHEPWDAPQYYVEKYDPGYTGLVINQPEYSPHDCLTIEEWRHVRALYAAEVTMVDRALGRLHQKLEDLGLYDTTVVIHLSDHGHMLGEHGIQGKPITGPLQLYEELARMVLMVRYPEGRGAGRRVDALVQPVDLCATILEIAGVPPEAEIWQGIDGYSVLPLLDGAAPWPRQVAYTSRHPFLQRCPTPVTITTGEWSYIYWPGGHGRRSELYRLPDDPRQERNRLHEQPQLAAELQREYLTWLAQRAPHMAEWITTVEGDESWLPDAALAWKGMT